MDAEDIVQETVISVARKMPEFLYDPEKGSNLASQELLYDDSTVL